MSSSHDLTIFISGVLAASYAVATLFFLRFWRQTGDRLFAFFAASFALLLVQRVANSFAPLWMERFAPYYLIRLVAFALIIAAIVDKNRSARP
jgi:hypothetical protein